jgi:hypothetical protein
MSSEQRETTQVVTSENQAEFFAQKLNLAPEETTEAADDAEPIESEVENEPEAEDEAPAIENEGKPSKLKARFSELTRQREQARADAQRERDAREALEARLAALEQGQAPRQALVADAKPTPDQFTDAFEYAEALAEFSAERALKERDRQDQERKAQEQQAKVVQTWTKRLEAAKAEIDDFDEMVASSDVVVPNHIRDAILESDVGPQILYHLASNQDQARTFNDLTPAQALRAIGKLEAKFEKSETSKPERSVVKSKAPAPINPIKSSNATADNLVNSKGEFHGTYAAWKAARQAGKIR